MIVIDSIYRELHDGIVLVAYTENNFELHDGIVEVVTWDSVF